MTVSLMAASLMGCAIASAGLSHGKERSFSQSLDEASAGRVIKARMSRTSSKTLGDVDVEVGHGVALLTGHVATPQDKILAERIAWSSPTVQQVGNEIIIDGEGGFFQGIKDMGLDSSIRTRLIADGGIKSKNVNVEVFDGTVYLLGIARTPEELHRIATVASETQGVREVVSYVKLYQPNVQSAGYEGGPQMPATQPYSAPIAPVPPSGLGSAPAPLPEGVKQGEAYYRDPVTGERITLPPGTKTVPYNPEAGGAGAPFYVDPETGEQIPVNYQDGRI